MENNQSCGLIKKTNLFKCFVVFLLICLLFPSTIYSSGIDPIPTMEELTLPQDLGFTENNQCTGHAFFMQAAANDQGEFIVYSRHVNAEDYTDVDYSKVYIDIYNSDGSFFRELSFMTPYDIVVELQTDQVRIYFWDAVLIYEIQTHQLAYYSLPSNYGWDSGLFSKLRSKTFTAGNWKYSCRKGIGSGTYYRMLSRSNDEDTQELIMMPGAMNQVTHVLLPGGILGLIIFSIAVIRFSKKRRRENDVFPSKINNSPQE